jgi:hypothetical protein
MRKMFVPAAAVATGALLLAVLPMTTASAKSDPSVLTVGKAGGSAVAKGAILKASLAKGTKGVFATNIKGVSVSCKSSSFTDKVTANPKAPGTATESLTAQTFGSCSISGIPGATISSVKLNKLPYKSTISDKKGNPVTVTGTNTTITIKVSGLKVSCSYKAKTTTGSASNKSQTIAFSKQPFTLYSGPTPTCASKGSFTATFGPVKDTSVKGSPSVYVN